MQELPLGPWLREAPVVVPVDSDLSEALEVLRQSLGVQPSQQPTHLPKRQRRHSAHGDRKGEDKDIWTLDNSILLV